MVADVLPSTIDELPTPSLVVDLDVFEANCAAMDAARPGRSLRPHVKAFKSTELARRLENDGHPAFCAATPREIEGLARAGVGDDLLLANESLDVARLGDLVADPSVEATITVAVDSDMVLDAAIGGGVRSVLIDIDVGLPRCGCDVETGERLAERARSAGLEVRGVMGYEGHLMMVEDPSEKSEKVAASMAVLLDAAARIGGDIVSGGGTGTYDTNSWCTEIQAGSYTLMDTHYGLLDSPFRQALSVLSTIISTPPKGWIVADAGLKSLGMDHGDPTWAGRGKVFFCSDEHVTLLPDEHSDWSVGDRVWLHPAHVDPTVARHERMWVVHGENVVDEWPIDLRHW
jgi:D-serine deaminase-like pyridoxal phosphate-dependent protein